MGFFQGFSQICGSELQVNLFLRSILHYLLSSIALLKSRVVLLDFVVDAVLLFLTYNKRQSAISVGHVQIKRLRLRCVLVQILIPFLSGHTDTKEETTQEKKQYITNVHSGDSFFKYGKM